MPRENEQRVAPSIWGNIESFTLESEPGAEFTARVFLTNVAVVGDPRDVSALGRVRLGIPENILEDHMAESGTGIVVTAQDSSNTSDTESVGYDEILDRSVAHGNGWDRSADLVFTPNHLPSVSTFGEAVIRPEFQMRELVLSAENVMLSEEDTKKGKVTKISLPDYFQNAITSKVIFKVGDKEFVFRKVDMDL